MVVGPATKTLVHGHALKEAFVMVSKKALMVTAQVLDFAAGSGILTNAFLIEVAARTTTPAKPSAPSKSHGASCVSKTFSWRILHLNFTTKRLETTDDAARHVLWRDIADAS